MALSSQSRQHLNKGKEYFKEEKYNEAIIELNHVIKEFESPFFVMTSAVANAYHYRGVSYTCLAKFDEAIADLSKVINFPDRVVSLVDLASIYLRQGNVDKAIETFNKAEKGNSQKFKNGIYNGRGHCYLRQGKIENALTEFKEAKELNPDDITSSKSYALACILLKYPNAIESCDEAAEIDRKNNNCKDSDYINFLCGLAYQNKGGFESAKKYFLSAWTNSSPTFDKLHYGIKLQTLSSKENQEEVKIDLRPLVTELATTQPETGSDYVTLASAYMLTQQFTLAKETCRNLLNKFLPLGIGIRWQKDFIEIITNPKCWPDTQDKQIENKNLNLLKEQLIDLISRIDDPQQKQYALLQSLCENTFMGRIFYKAQGYKTPSIRSGSLQKIYNMLAESVRKQNNISVLDKETWHAIQATPRVKEQLQLYFPEFYQRLEGSISSVEKTNDVASLNKEDIEFNNQYASMTKKLDQIPRPSAPFAVEEVLVSAPISYPKDCAEDLISFSDKTNAIRVEPKKQAPLDYIDISYLYLAEKEEESKKREQESQQKLNKYLNEIAMFKSVNTATAASATAVQEKPAPKEEKAAVSVSASPQRALGLFPAEQKQTPATTIKKEQTVEELLMLAPNVVTDALPVLKPSPIQSNKIAIRLP